MRVDSDDDHDKTREYVWRKSSRLAQLVARKLTTATKSLLEPSPLYPEPYSNQQQQQEEPQQKPINKRKPSSQDEEDEDEEELTSIHGAIAVMRSPWIANARYTR